MTALQILEIELIGENSPLPMERVTASAMNGLSHTILGQQVAALVDEMHKKGAGPSPFSVCALFDAGCLTGLRLATLQAEVGGQAEMAWRALSGKGRIRLGNHYLRVGEVYGGREQARSFDDLYESTPAAHEVSMHFISPMRLRTTISKGNSRWTLLPQSKAVWGYYALRWEKFGGRPLPPEFLAWVEKCVLVTHISVDTQYAYAEKNVEWRGVVGQVGYQAFTPEETIPASRQAEYLKAWQALARLAEYCGTGEKTTMGMGRTIVK